MTTGSIALPSEVRALILFGSHARGDADEHSDVDVCAFVSDVGFERLVELRHDCAMAMGAQEESASVYPASMLWTMAEVGSLFLWHLKLEGRVVCDPSGFAAEILDELAPFTEFAEELDLYEDLLRGVQEQQLRHTSLVEFDLHVLFLVARNTSILLAYARGEPTFGRTSAFQLVVQSIGPLPVEAQTYAELCDWHLTYVRGVRRSPLPTSEQCAAYINAVDAYLLDARKVLL